MCVCVVDYPRVGIGQQQKYLGCNDVARSRMNSLSSSCYPISFSMIIDSAMRFLGDGWVDRYIVNYSGYARTVDGAFFMSGR